jgi:hypothetical protein
MSKKQRIPERPNGIEKLVRWVKRVLAFLITLLAAALLVLVLEIGKGSWSIWMTDYRTQIIAGLLLGLGFLLLWYPVMIEVTRHTRPLSGPGKNPENPNYPY